MLEIKNICAGYDKKRVISDISFEVERGSIISVIGANGCGKSTLMRAIAGVLVTYDGEVVIDGEPEEKLGRLGVARKISYLAQGKGVPDMTVGQTVLHGRFPHLSYPRRYGKRDREIARDAMSAVGISKLADCPMSMLSGGMRQNAYIAMALAQDTDHILLDEPTTYLDIRHQLELMKLLKKLAESGKSIVTVMHDLPLAFDFSDEIAVLDGGRIIIQAPPAELCGNPVLPEIFGIRINQTEGKDKYYYEA